MEIAVGATTCVRYLEVVRFSEGRGFTVVDYIPFVVREYFDCHVTNLLESDWHALYGVRRHGP